MKAVELRAYTIVSYCKKADATDERSKQYNELIYALKDGNPILRRDEGGGGSFRDAADVFAEVVHHQVRSWFPGSVLVPIPGSGVSPVDRSREPPVAFARALQRLYGGSLFLGLVRKIPGLPAHRVAPSERRTVEQHVQSLELRGTLPPSQGPVVLVDDVMTRGTIAAACTALLEPQCAGREVRLVTAAYTRFADQAAEEDVLWRLQWSGGDHPAKLRLEALS